MERIEPRISEQLGGWWMHQKEVREELNADKILKGCKE
jgi:hypothetical protein